MSVESKFLILTNKIVDSINIIETNQGDLTSLTTSDKSSLVAALVEVKVLIDNHYAEQQALINDGVINTTKTWSSSKIENEIMQAIADLIDGSPAVLDTLKELANALQNNPDIITEILAALDKRVAVNLVQSFTSLEKTQARTNIDSASNTEFQLLVTNLGNIDYDWAGQFNSEII